MRPATLTLGSIQINTKTKQVTKTGKSVRLRKKEYELLEFLAINKNRVLNKLTILEYVWNYNTAIKTNTLEVHMTALRKKIKDKFGPTIKTVHGLGYALMDSVTQRYSQDSLNNPEQHPSEDQYHLNNHLRYS